MGGALLSAATLGLDEMSLLRLARAADSLLTLPDGFTQGPWQARRRPGSGQEFHDFQPYRPGDDVRRVDWRASARSRVLLQRRYRDATSTQWCVCLDKSVSMDFSGRLAVQLAAALAFMLLHREHGVGCMTFSEGVDTSCAPGRGRAHFARVLEALARDTVPGRGSRLETCVARMKPRQSVAVVSDFLAEDAMMDDLGRLARLGGQVHVLQIVHQEAGPHSFQPGAVVRDVESGQELRPADPAEAAAQASAALGRQRHALAAFCRRNRLAYSACSVALPWQQQLLAHLGRARQLDA